MIVNKIYFIFYFLSIFCIMTQFNIAQEKKEGEDSAILQIESGAISGIVLDTQPVVTVYKGIPYAMPPVGDLRWCPPQPVKAWQDVRACTKYGPSCPQPSAPFNDEVESKFSEDCLYLNVWTAAVKGQEKKLPVMVWIHGGGFAIGSGSKSYYSGEHLALKGVVVVTINYRLGPFGFLAHPLLSKESSHNVSGNYGLLDQIAALQWVQKNIASFGGDPNCVTIFGESAGALSVCRLMVSPLSKGLFHRAIAQSGGAWSRNRHLREAWYDQEPMEKLGERVAKLLGCHKAENPVSAMRKKTALEILQVTNPLAGLYGDGDKYGPIIDGWVLPDDPASLFLEGKYHDVPFITGSNADEGTIFLPEIPVTGSWSYNWAVRQYSKSFSNEILQLFPTPDKKDLRVRMNSLITVSSFVAPARFLCQTMAGNKKAYLYHFAHVPPTRKQEDYGSFHGAEIFYIFGTFPRIWRLTELDYRLFNKMSGYWIRFARTGNPDGDEEPKWIPYSIESDNHLEFGAESIEVKYGLHRKACDLFEKIYLQRMKSWKKN